MEDDSWWRDDDLAVIEDPSALEHVAICGVKCIECQSNKAASLTGWYKGQACGEIRCPECGMLYKYRKHKNREDWRIDRIGRGEFQKELVYECIKSKLAYENKKRIGYKSNEEKIEKENRTENGIEINYTKDS